MQLRGLAGTDVTINAPLGVTVLTDEGEVLGDLTTNNQTITVAQGIGEIYFFTKPWIRIRIHLKCWIRIQGPMYYGTDLSDSNPEVLVDLTAKNQTIIVAQGTVRVYWWHCSGSAFGSVGSFFSAYPGPLVTSIDPAPDPFLFSCVKRTEIMVAKLNF
jgi:hypothetical protein